MADAPAVCEHLRPLVDYLIASGAKIVYAGQPWSRNCRLWVYFDRALDIEGIRRELPLATCVKLHTHRGTHDGSETGFVCEEHHDAVMGLWVETAL